MCVCSTVRNLNLQMAKKQIKINYRQPSKVRNTFENSLFSTTVSKKATKINKSLNWVAKLFQYYQSKGLIM